MFDAQAISPACGLHPLTCHSFRRRIFTANPRDFLIVTSSIRMAVPGNGRDRPHSSAINSRPNLTFPSTGTWPWFNAFEFFMFFVDRGFISVVAFIIPFFL
jgi:hypothetical protein